MRNSSLEELLKILEEDTTSEMENEGLSSWLLNATNKDITSFLEEFSPSALNSIKEDLLDGSRALLQIDITDALLEHLESLEASSDEDSSDDEEDYEDYDSEDEEDDDDYYS